MKLAIDPGHGMGNVNENRYDPGCVHNGYSEADIVLKVGVSLAWVLGTLGIDTYLTRTSDTYVAPLRSRDELAKEEGCTHYLSLHCNCADSSSANGVECFFRDSKDRDFATHMLNATIQALNLESRGVKNEKESQHKRLSVLDFDGPACLLELGFLTGSRDFHALKRLYLERATRVALAMEIGEAILDGLVQAN